MWYTTSVPYIDPIRPIWLDFDEKLSHIFSRNIRKQAFFVCNSYVPLEKARGDGWNNYPTTLVRVMDLRRAYVYKPHIGFLSLAFPCIRILRTCWTLHFKVIALSRIYQIFFGMFHWSIIYQFIQLLDLQSLYYWYACLF